MLTPQDTPTAEDVLRGHQWSRSGITCTCGVLVERKPERNGMAMAVHQLGVLAASGLAVVSIHGTAGVVKAAAAVAAKAHAGIPVDELHESILLMRQRLEAMTL